MLQRDAIGAGCIFDATTWGPGRAMRASRRGGEVERREYHQVCSARGARVSDPHILLLPHVCAAFCDIQSGCAQVWHEEHLGDCFEAVLNQITIGDHLGVGMHGTADQPFITVLRGIASAVATLWGRQVSPPHVPLSCV